jgi:hypothetical protein
MTERSTIEPLNARPSGYPSRSRIAPARGIAMVPGFQPGNGRVRKGLGCVAEPGSMGGGGRCDVYL